MRPAGKSGEIQGIFPEKFNLFGCVTLCGEAFGNQVLITDSRAMRPNRA